MDLKAYLGCAVVFVLSLVLAQTATADKLPPRELLAEVSAKAEAVILVDLDSAQIPPGGFVATAVRVRKVYRGPLRAGTRLTYYSSRETSIYPKAWRDHGLVVFLVSRRNGGRLEWGAAGEFFEFEFSRKLEKSVLQHIGRKIM